MSEIDKPNKMIEVPDSFKEHVEDYKIPEMRTAMLGAEAAKNASSSVEDGRSGRGIVHDVPMPADPSRVPGWEGTVRR